jgi:uncharacterized membrane protein
MGRRANSQTSIIFRMSGMAIFSALAFVLSAFCAIPYPGGAGYFNFGDVATLFVAMAYGPLEGALVGIIGGTMSDLFLGWASYAPFTMIAKGLMGIVTGLLFQMLKKHRIWRFAAPFIGSLLMVVTYFFAYLILVGWGACLNSLADFVQGFGCAAVSIPIFLLMEKTGVLKRISAQNQPSDSAK